MTEKYRLIAEDDEGNRRLVGETTEFFAEGSTISLTNLAVPEEEGVNAPPPPEMPEEMPHEKHVVSGGHHVIPASKDQVITITFQIAPVQPVQSPCGCRDGRPCDQDAIAAGKHVYP